MKPVIEDDLRKTGFSKDGRHQNPQIFIGLLVGLGGYAIGYDIFEDNTYEGHTLNPFLEKGVPTFKTGDKLTTEDFEMLVIAEKFLKMHKRTISGIVNKGFNGMRMFLPSKGGQFVFFPPFPAIS